MVTLGDDSPRRHRDLDGRLRHAYRCPEMRGRRPRTFVPPDERLTEELSQPVGKVERMFDVMTTTDLPIAAVAEVLDGLTGEDLGLVRSGDLAADVVEASAAAASVVSGSRICDQ